MKKTTPLVLTSLLSLSAWSLQAIAQDNATAVPAGPPPAAAPAPEVVPAVPAPAPAAAPKKKGGSGPALGLDPNAPQVSGLVTTTSEAPAAVAEPVTGEWKFDVTGYFRAPLRFSWGPPTTPDPFGQGNPGTQWRTPPLVPDANYIDWRYTNSMVGPWTELNFHYGNDRVKATVQIASYNVTDSGYRRLESNLGINEAFLSMTWPEFLSENARLTLIAGAYTNRYGAAGRYDAGRYETYLFGRTHTAGETLTCDYDWNDWTFEVEGGFGGKLEPIPFYGPPAGNSASVSANQNLPAWEPYPGPVPQESTFVAHAHLGAVFKKELIIGAHLIYVFSNDNERAGSYSGRDQSLVGRDDGHRQRDAQPEVAGAAADGLEAEHRDLRPGREAPGRRAGRRVHRVLAPVGDERALSGGRHRGVALVRRLAAARQLLRRPGRRRSGDGDDRQRGAAVQLQLRAAVPLPAGLLGRRAGPDRDGVRDVQPRERADESARSRWTS